MRRFDKLDNFIKESNKIEGIYNLNLVDTQRTVYERLLGQKEIEVNDLKFFVYHIQPGFKLRDKLGMDVRVGNYIPPPGGKDIILLLTAILDRINKNLFLPFTMHKVYEELHPFMDGNGRSGRLLWAWQMLRFGHRPGLDLGFLHAWYYQSLDEDSS